MVHRFSCLLRAPNRGDMEWRFDPNSGLYFQLSTQCYYDGKSGMYYKDGKWSATQP